MQPIGSTTSSIQNFTPASEKPFRVKEAVKDAFDTLEKTFMFTGFLGILTFAANPIGGALLMGGSLLGLAAIRVARAWEGTKGEVPEPVRNAMHQIQGLITEAFVFLGSSFLPDLTGKNPKTKEEIDPNETPILMIHGFSNSSSSWHYHRKRLKEAGHKNLFTINLGDPRLSIEEDYVKKVDEMVQEIKKLTGRNDIVFVAHSMGGLVAREWRQNYAIDTEVKDIVTLGTPHDGTRLAHLTLGLSKCGKEMLPGSPLIEKQQEIAATDTETNYLHIGSRADHVVIPEGSAYWGSAPNTEIVTLDATGHGGMLFSDTVGDILVSHLAHCLNTKN